MTSRKKNYDQALLQYYYGKDLSRLSLERNKFKRYADRLAKKCESVKTSIDLLYEDYRQANVFNQNAQRLRNRLYKEQKLLDDGIEKPEKFPWCPKDEEEEEEDLIEEFRRDEIIKKMEIEKTTILELKRWYDPIVSKIIGSRKLDAVYNMCKNNTEDTPESLEAETDQLNTANSKLLDEIDTSETQVKMLKLKLYCAEKALGIYKSNSTVPTTITNDTSTDTTNMINFFKNDIKWQRYCGFNPSGRKHLVDFTATFLVEKFSDKLPRNWSYYPSHATSNSHIYYTYSPSV